VLIIVYVRRASCFKVVGTVVMFLPQNIWRWVNHKKDETPVSVRVIMLEVICYLQIIETLNAVFDLYVYGMTLL
jgi:hypothetical protein